MAKVELMLPCQRPIVIASDPKKRGRLHYGSLGGAALFLWPCWLQVGFFEIVALPLFKGFVELIPSTKPILDGVMANYEHWRGLQQD